MKTIKERLEEDYIPGCIKYKDEYQYYIMPIAWWILDYAKYDPSILTDDTFNFRNGVYTVTDNEIEKYLDSISVDKISVSEVKSISENFSEEYSRITFLIDFDKKLYISGFDDIEIEAYLPSSSWIGKFDWNPGNYISSNFSNQ
ncbi:MAG: hypothetical protein ABJB11_09710 [Ferruginibacter sp.]